MIAVATSFDGVNTATPIRGYASNSNAGTTASVTISSASNDLAFDLVCNGTSVDSSSQTTIFLENYNTDSGCDTGGESTKAGASSVTMTWSTSNDHWIDLAASLEPTLAAISWSVPNDWNSASNTIEVIGGGGGGGYSDGSALEFAGGGGGAYSAITNLGLTPGANVSYSAGSGGGGATEADSVLAINGGDTWFDSTSTLLAKGGEGGNVNADASVLGGQASSGVGTVRYSGGGSYIDGGGAALTAPARTTSTLTAADTTVPPWEVRAMPGTAAPAGLDIPFHQVTAPAAGLERSGTAPMVPAAVAVAPGARTPVVLAVISAAAAAMCTTRLTPRAPGAPVPKASSSSPTRR